MKAILYKELSNKQTIKEISSNQPIFKAFPELDFENTICIVNGKKTTLDYIIKENDTVLLRLLPSGGPSLDPITRTVFAILTGGMSEVYHYGEKFFDAINAIWNMDSPETPKQINNPSVDNRPFLKGASNTLATGNSQPYICGERLFTPYLLCSPFYELSGLDGTDQFIYIALECGFNKQVIKKIFTDDVLIKTFNDVEPQECSFNLDGTVFSQGGLGEISQDGELLETLPQLNYKYVSTANNAEIPKETVVNKGDAERLTFTLNEHAKNVDIVISFPYGLYEYDEQNNRKNSTVDVIPEYSLDGGVQWQSFEFYQNGTYSNTFTRNEDSKELRFNAHKEFSLLDYITLKNNNQTNIWVRLKNNSENNAKKRNSVYCLYYQSLCFDPNKSSYPAGIIQDDGDAGLVNCLNLEEKERSRSTILAIRLKATKINKDKLKKINVITQGVARTWNGTEWSSTKSITKNASAWALEILTSPTHKASQFLDEELDLESFGDFYEYCQINNFNFNYVISQNQKKNDTLSLIFNSCNAILYKDIYARYAVAIDQEKENAIAVYNPQNIKTITNKKSFIRHTDALRIKYVNSCNDLYEEDTYLVLREGETLNENSIIKDISVSGITEYEHIVKYARRIMAVESLRAKTTTIEVGAEGIYLTPYSKVLIQDDSLKIGTGNAVIKGVISSNLKITKLILNGKVTFEQNKNYGIIVNCFNQDESITPLSLVVSGNGTTDILDVVTEVSINAEIQPAVNNILSFGELSSEGTFEKITTPYLISNISSNSNNGYVLDLVNYDEAIYDSGSIPEYISNITQKPSDNNTDIPEDFITKNEVYSELVNIENGNAIVGCPSIPVNVKAVASQDSIALSCSIESTGLRNTIKKIVWSINKNGVTQTLETSSTNATYKFNRAVDGYPESTSLELWTVKAYAVNVYDKQSENSSIVCVSTTSYGTWKVSNPIINTRVSDRTITLMLSQGARADNKTVYGNVFYEVQIRKPNVDSADQWFKPATSKDPYVNEENYKDGLGFVTSQNVYIQTMPLTGQDTNNIFDTQYQFRVRAKNETDTSEYVLINATALCTNIQDLVKANETAKEAYIGNLSALSANLGVIKQGSLSGNDSNYWALSTMTDDNGNTRYQGAMRVGGENEYLKVEPIVDNGVIVNYEVSFKVGNFEVNSVETKLLGEQIITSNFDKHHRVYLSPQKIAIQHNDTPSNRNTWVDLSRLNPSGFLGTSLLSKDKLIITNQNIEERRNDKIDIGQPFLSANTKVYHFDTDRKDQNGVDDLIIEDSTAIGDRASELVGQDDIIQNENDEGIDCTPAVLTYSPYSEVGRSLFGNFFIQKSFSTIGAYTIDFWLKFLGAENQIIFNSGDDNHTISLFIVNDEPYYNDIDTISDDVCYNEETRTPNANAYYQYEKTQECYFADGYNEKLETESVYNTLVNEPFNESFVYYVKNGTLYVVTSVTPYDYDLLVEQGLYKQMCVYNQIKLADIIVRHQTIFERVDVSLREKDFIFKIGEWYHIALVQDFAKTKVFVGNEENRNLVEEFNYGASETEITAIFNPTKMSFFIDELVMDNSVSLDFEIFKEQTKQRKPYGFLDDSIDWSILTVKDIEHFKTNIFESDLFKQAVENIVELDITKSVIENVAVPIGFIYVQYPNMKAPYEVWETITVEKWANISSEYAGDFFRAEGGNASAFESGRQAEELPNVKGSLLNTGVNGLGVFTGASGAITLGGGASINADSGDWVSGFYREAYFNASNSSPIYKDNGHVTPINQTIKIWKRIK